MSEILKKLDQIQKEKENENKSIDENEKYEYKYENINENENKNKNEQNTNKQKLINKFLLIKFISINKQKLKILITCLICVSFIICCIRFYLFFSSSNKYKQTTNSIQKLYNDKKYVREVNSQAINHFKNHNYYAAIGLWTPLLNGIHSQDIQINLALAYKVLNDHKSSLSLINSVLEKNPNNTFALNNRGMIYLHQKDFLNAEVDFIKASINNNQFYEPIFNLATLYELEGRLDKAIENYQKFLSLKGNTFKSEHHDIVTKIEARLKKLNVLLYFEEKNDH
ncbi:MAG: hypothetical protein HQK49_05040 [Oligoflexia bacterium]|nr:hypothetical protein [Oligoflexia bacterium]